MYQTPSKRATQKQLIMQKMYDKYFLENFPKTLELLSEMEPGTREHRRWRVLQQQLKAFSR